MSSLTEQKTKSFWERPEGTTGMLTIAAAGVGLWFAGPALIRLFDTAITLVGQGITLTVLGAILVALLYVLTNPQFQTLVGYMFKSAMRKVTQVFVEIDPIGIMRNYVRELEQKREVMDSARGKLKGQITQLKRTIRENEQGFTEAMKLAQAAKAQGNQGALRVQGNQAGRLEKLNRESFGPMLAQMEAHAAVLQKYYEVTGIVIEDLTNEVKMREIERSAILASHTAMKAAKQIIMGGTDSRELFDMATEHVANDYALKIGEIDSFIENSKGFVDGIDLQTGVYEADALARLQEWEARGDSVLLGSGGKQALISSSATPGFASTASLVPSSVPDYATLLNSSQSRPDAR